ncbi:hypothetical protein HKB23_10930, partial [Vibrio parahaemolyticus]|nr:hypothetical protein [Vibrio parahaemolyticus]
VAPVERQKTTRERTVLQRLERQEELRYTASDEKRWAENRERVLAERKAAQQAYGLTEKEWDDDLQKQAKEYQWDTSQQENV